MDRIKVNGNETLYGNLRVSGAKNSILPILIASTLGSGISTISNIPHLKDVTTCLELMQVLGSKVALNSDLALEIDSSNIDCFEAPDYLVRSMRASILVLGPILSRFGHVRIAVPGGCAIGIRKIDIHLEGLKQMGADVIVGDDYIEMSCKKLQGTTINMSKNTVTGTENLLMAATLAEGKTILQNCAFEPEVTDLLDFLVKMGAKIKGRGTRTLEIDGVQSLRGVEHSVIPDRIETGTFLVAAAIVKGRITLTNTRSEHIIIILEKLQEAGCHVEVNGNVIILDATQATLKAISVETQPYPGFPTDMQAQWMLLNTVAQGNSTIKETIFENRFMHVLEMNKMGAKIKTKDNIAEITGGCKLYGATVKATDLRASAALIIAGLVATGKTMIENVFHVDRGYELIEEKLHLLGANIYRL